MNTNTNNPATPTNDLHEGTLTNEEKINPTDPGIKSRNPDTEVPEIGDDEFDTIEDGTKKEDETATENPAGSDKPTITNSPDMTEPKDSPAEPDKAVI